MKNTSTPQWLAEFGPEWEVPAELASNPQFEDKSWRQDAGPTFWTVKKYTKGGIDYRNTIWVQHPDASKREFPIGRFLVSSTAIDSEDADQISGENEGADLLETDDILAAIERALQEVAL